MNVQIKMKLTSIRKWSKIKWSNSTKPANQTECETAGEVYS